MSILGDNHTEGAQEQDHIWHHDSAERVDESCWWCIEEAAERAERRLAEAIEERAELLQARLETVRELRTLVV